MHLALSRMVGMVWVSGNCSFYLDSKAQLIFTIGNTDPTSPESMKQAIPMRVLHNGLIAIRYLRALQLRSFSALLGRGLLRPLTARKGKSLVRKMACNSSFSTTSALTRRMMRRASSRAVSF